MDGVSSLVQLILKDDGSGEGLQFDLKVTTPQFVPIREISGGKRRGGLAGSCCDTVRLWEHGTRGFFERAEKSFNARTASMGNQLKNTVETPTTVRKYTMAYFPLLGGMQAKSRVPGQKGLWAEPQEMLLSGARPQQCFCKPQRVTGAQG